LDFDCKRKNDPNIGAPDGRDKEKLGIMLSAFSNSMGGLLLWGVDARKHNGIDCVSGFEPIEDIGVFESGIKTLAIEAARRRNWLHQRFCAYWREKWPCQTVAAATPQASVTITNKSRHVSIHSPSSRSSSSPAMIFFPPRVAA
jgi:hypothetical protein